MQDRKAKTVTLGNELLSVGIKLTFHPSFSMPLVERWSAKVEFRTKRIGTVDAISGTIGTQYMDTDLSKVIDRVVEAAESIGVTFIKNDQVQPLIYVDEDPQARAQMPDNWRDQVFKESERLGWDCLYLKKPQTMTGEVMAGLIEKGYAVRASKSQPGRFRWWMATGSDGESVPKEELAEETHATEEEAWAAALLDSMGRAGS